MAGKSPKTSFSQALRNQHRNHIHGALRPGHFLDVPSTPAPIPAPTPAVYGPIVHHGDDMQSQTFTTASLDEHGNGYIDTHIPFKKLVNIVPLGPSPDRDGYSWPTGIENRETTPAVRHVSRSKAARLMRRSGSSRGGSIERLKLDNRSPYAIGDVKLVAAVNTLCVLAWLFMTPSRTSGAAYMFTELSEVR